MESAEDFFSTIADGVYHKSLVAWKEQASLASVPWPFFCWFHYYDWIVVAALRWGGSLGRGQKRGGVKWTKS